MTGRIPLIPTLVVALAVAIMIALGVWQLDRRHEKAAALAQYRANLSLPETAYPANPTDQSYLFRTVRAHCLRVTGWQTKGGAMPGGRPGWRRIATCATGAEGPGLIVDIGMTPDPKAAPAWTGGDVSGTAMWEPDSSSALSRWLGQKVPLRLMIVSRTGEIGLKPSPRPDPAEVPNNHLAYAVQWFLFAGVAVIIYPLALRYRRRGAA
ncbi:SURF1 family protein [Sphingobium sufflavum]|uniref:SURF1 family protein n=1 Tax=Sphingobium sufflavum TaxID=1129547 RepID=UPI001F3699B8|nr:SURF1 family protein [Sphingobium sufflavum]MCE7798790.1 SURF1 family protein [Sphingobium sufflavum]